MKMRKLFKTTALSLLLIYSFTACNNDVLVDTSNSPITKSAEQQDRSIKLQKILEKYKDTPIQSLFNAKATREVLNGQCVIGAIQYCGSHVGITISTDDIVNYLGDKVIKDSAGNITGVSLNSQDWNDLLNRWFNASYPQGQSDLIDKVSNGNIACCRLGSDRTHAIVLIGVDENAEVFKYYDPVLGGEYHTVSFTNVYDPRLISR